MLEGTQGKHKGHVLHKGPSYILVLRRPDRTGGGLQDRECRVAQGVRGETKKVQGVILEGTVRAYQKTEGNRTCSVWVLKDAGFAND